MLPTYRSARLTLRPLEAADAPRLQLYASDWDVARMLALVPHPYPEGEAEAFIADMEGAPSADVPWHVFAIASAADGGFIGTLGVTSDDDFAGPAVGLGYWIGRPFWGRGYMTEAVLLALGEHVFGRLGKAEVASGMFTDNAASWRIQEKLGFERLGERMKFCLARGGEYPHIETRLTRAAFRGIGA